MLRELVPKRLPLNTKQSEDSNLFLKEIISRILSEAGDPSDVQKIKASVCRKYSLERMPRNSEIFALAKEDERERLRGFLQVKPARTISGVAPVAVMTSPHPCPHGKCLPCPGGPEHPFGSPQSYTGEEPAALRARQHEYDPYAQVQARLRQFEELGHHVDKAELIVMGGTITARDPEYRDWFMRSCIRAMNEYGGGDPGDIYNFEQLSLQNETAKVRCIAATFETRPDWCGREHIDDMLRLGVTKVELGVQQLDNTILEFNRRGHGVEATEEANRLLRDAGLKVGFHVMPNLPSATVEDDKRMFDLLFSDERFCPDFLKIYPTLVTPGSEIEELWMSGEYDVYDEDELIDLVAYGKSRLPPYVRLQRIQRDIPAKLIVRGSHFSNFRQLAKERLESSGGRCRCIRCSEAGRNVIREPPEIDVIHYKCCGGDEFFIRYISGESLIGFIRLRFPYDPWRDEISDSALVRELHVYGSVVPISERAGPGEWQHRNFGDSLLKEAERIAGESGYGSVGIMSGIGVRPYYRKKGYHRDGPYMVKEL
ncbi:MAG: tRNA uridine(34) 5-carboxymethylaminomethyl modification radical SAM/GNAT enzyme Elp3 [Methanomicrobiaceae archaeon]|nr:tRNA uridine(34) 5-carboxymethylaminomethyl modification radical SAM/GNAT enzyme Elp3 [Methanomicrobiaceae archaeon]